MLKEKKEKAPKVKKYKIQQDDLIGDEIENIDINGGSNIDYDIRKCITYIDIIL